MACEKPCPVIGWYPTKNQIERKEVVYMIKGVYPVNVRKSKKKAMLLLCLMSPYNKLII